MKFVNCKEFPGGEEILLNLECVKKIRRWNQMDRKPILEDKDGKMYTCYIANRGEIFYDLNSCLVEMPTGVGYNQAYERSVK